MRQLLMYATRIDGEECRVTKVTGPWDTPHVGVFVGKRSFSEEASASTPSQVSTDTLSNLGCVPRRQVPEIRKHQRGIERKRRPSSTKICKICNVLKCVDDNYVNSKESWGNHQLLFYTFICSQMFIIFNYTIYKCWISIMYFIIFQNQLDSSIY